MTTYTPGMTSPTATPKRPTAPSTRWDRLGIVASAACVVHCIASPIVLLLMPVWGAWWSHPAAHIVLAVLVLPLAAVVIFRGYQKHGRRSAIIALALGIIFILAGLVFPHLENPPRLTLGTASAAAAPVPMDLAAEGATCSIPSDGHHVSGAAATSGHGATGCTECLPSVGYDPATGAASLTLPAGGLTTLIGSIFLVAAHFINLRGCGCLKRQAADAGV